MKTGIIISGFKHTHTLPFLSADLCLAHFVHNLCSRPRQWEENMTAFIVKAYKQLNITSFQQITPAQVTGGGASLMS